MLLFSNRYNSYFSDNRVRLWLFVTWLVAPMFLLPFLTVSLLNEMNNVPLITGWKSDQLLCTFVSLPGMWKSYMLASIRLCIDCFQIFEKQYPTCKSVKPLQYSSIYSAHKSWSSSNIFLSDLYWLRLKEVDTESVFVVLQAQVLVFIHFRNTRVL